MQTIPMSLASAGMVLTKDIKNPDNPDGLPVCGKGVVLTESLLSRLRNMGIRAITVEGHPVMMEGDKTPEEMLGILDKRFKRVMDDPFMKKLKEIYRRNIFRSMGEEDGR